MSCIYILHILPIYHNITLNRSTIAEILEFLNTKISVQDPDLSGFEIIWSRILPFYTLSKCFGRIRIQVFSWPKCTKFCFWNITFYVLSQIAVKTLMEDSQAIVKTIRPLCKMVDALFNLKSWIFFSFWTPSWLSWIRIHIANTDSDPDPG